MCLCVCRSAPRNLCDHGVAINAGASEPTPSRAAQCPDAPNLRPRPPGPWWKWGLCYPNLSIKLLIWHTHTQKKDLNFHLNLQSGLFAIAGSLIFLTAFQRLQFELVKKGLWGGPCLLLQVTLHSFLCFPATQTSPSSWHTLCSPALDFSLFVPSARNIASDSTPTPLLSSLNLLALERLIFFLFQAGLGVPPFSTLFQCSVWSQVHLLWHHIRNFLSISRDSELVEQEPSLFPPGLHGSIPKGYRKCPWHLLDRRMKEGEMWFSSETQASGLNCVSWFI